MNCLDEKKVSLVPNLENMTREERIERVRRIASGKRHLRSLILEIREPQRGFAKIFIDAEAIPKFQEVVEELFIFEDVFKIYDFKHLSPENVSTVLFSRFFNADKNVLVIVDSWMRQLEYLRQIPMDKIVNDRSDAIYVIFREDEKFKSVCLKLTDRYYMEKEADSCGKRNSKTFSV